MTESTDRDSAIDLPDLEAALREVEPAAVFVPSWLLENIIAADRDIRGPLFSIPHDHSHVIERERLVQLASDEDLPLQSELPADQSVLVLLEKPDGEWLASTPGPQALLAYWRLLFHATLDAVFRAKRSDGSLDEPRVQQRIERLGRSSFREAEFVLQKEKLLSSDASDVETYGEFAATFLELLNFEPWTLHWYFPAAEVDRMTSVLAEDVDAAAVFARTRLAGSADPAQEPLDTEDRPEADAEETEPKAAKRDSDRKRGKMLVARAEAAEAKGNDVRAAITRMRAARVMPANEAGKLRGAAARRVDALAARLRAAIGLDESDYDPWRAVLRVLLNRSDTAWWNNERRLLYDLQKACVCHEREIYSANVVEWLLDWCKRPIRRPQPVQRLVTAHKALRTAERRAMKVRLPAHDRALLRKLLHAAVQQAERRLRNELRPAIIHALEEGDLCPRDAVERVAEDKLVDELLDGVVHRGYLNLGNLRDAVSRNQLKLNDLSGPRELLGRDQLLRADRKLELALDGVYHRGEFYLRLFQRLSSVLFGTAAGRALTRVLLIPFIGAFIVLEGLDHSVGIGLHKLAHVSPKYHFSVLPAQILLGLFIMGLINFASFRAVSLRFARFLGRGLRTVFFDFPKWLGQLRLFRLLFTSHVARLLFRYGGKPLGVAVLIALLLPDSILPGSRSAAMVVIYLVATLLMNSPAGRAFEQTLLHALRVTLPRFTWDILVGLLRLVINAFDRLLESVDRALYAVDEWLRFGASQSRAVIVFKAALGVVWFYVAYVTRFAINLLVEPQINPIKHFPVVTVSHKIILPLGLPEGPLSDVFARVGLSQAKANTLAGSIVWGIPGIFGFLAWELKENWRLYRANRSPVLRPVRVGSHGETFAQLIRPGFHSGTLPKLFARVRKSARRLRERPDSADELVPTAKDRDAAHHVQESVCAFVERELVNLLNRHPIWMPTPVSVGEVELAATRVRIELRCEAIGAESSVMSFDQRDGLIVASIDRAGWMIALSKPHAELLRAALIGFYKLAAVDLVSEHVRASMRAADLPIHFDLRRRQLVVWPAGQFDRETTFDLDDESAADARRLMLRHVNVPWHVWRSVWDTQSPLELSKLAGQVGGDVEVLPPDCGRRDDSATQRTDEFPVIARESLPAAS